MPDKMECPDCGGRLFVCDLCKDTFHSETSQGEMAAEYMRNFTDEERKEKRARVCDDCYERVMTNMKNRRSRN